MKLNRYPPSIHPSALPPSIPPSVHPSLHFIPPFLLHSSLQPPCQRWEGAFLQPLSLSVHTYTPIYFLLLSLLSSRSSSLSPTLLSFPALRTELEFAEVN